METSKTAALIVAAGQGSRAAGDRPKQYRLLAGKPLLAHSIEVFKQHPGIGPILVVIHEAHQKLYDSLKRPPESVIGGATRQESVRLGLQALRAHNPTKVLIHDAARPLVGPAVIGRVIEGLNAQKAVVPVLPVSDTLKILNKGKVETADRNCFYRAQTPQGFDFELILSLHEKYARREATDDAMLAEWAGIGVGFVPGEERNIKITTAADFKLAEAL